MKRYKKILVPYDDSKLSKLAFEQALSLASMVKGEVTVIHVMETSLYEQLTFETTEVISVLNTLVDENKGRIESMLKDLVEQGKKEDVKVDYLIKDGNVASEIIVASSNFDLIIMGTLGQSALDSLLLGSKAEKVARHACCPVMLVREQNLTRKNNIER